MSGDLKGRWFTAKEKFNLLRLVQSTSDLSIKRGCEVLGLTTSRYYRWKKRYEAGGMDGLKNRKSSPHGCPHTLLPEEREQVVAYALEHPGIRHRKLAYKMQDEAVCWVSPSSVYRVLRKEGLIAHRTHEKRKPANGEVPAPAVNRVWHSDITYIPVGDRFAYMITILDGCTRFPVHWELCRSQNAADVTRVYDRALVKTGLTDSEDKPVLITDNGSQYLAKDFTALLEDLGVEHRTIAIGHPESNGKIEVFHKTLKYEHVYVHEQYETFYEAKEDIGRFMTHYANEPSPRTGGCTRAWGMSHPGMRTKDELRRISTNGNRHIKRRSSEGHGSTSNRCNIKG